MHHLRLGGSSKKELMRKSRTSPCRPNSPQKNGIDSRIFSNPTRNHVYLWVCLDFVGHHCEAVATWTRWTTRFHKWEGILTDEKLYDVTIDTHRLHYLHRYRLYHRFIFGTFSTNAGDDKRCAGLEAIQGDVKWKSMCIAPTTVISYIATSFWYIVEWRSPGIPFVISNC